MFGISEEEIKIKYLMEQFNLQGLSEVQKTTLMDMAKNHSLVTSSDMEITDVAFKNTLIYQNWLILGKLIEISKK